MDGMLDLADFRPADLDQIAAGAFLPDQHAGLFKDRRMCGDFLQELIAGLVDIRVELAPELPHAPTEKEMESALQGEAERKIDGEYDDGVADHVVFPSPYRFRRII